MISHAARQGYKVIFITGRTHKRHNISTSWTPCMCREGVHYECFESEISRVRYIGILVMYIASKEFSTRPVLHCPAWWRHQMDTFSALLAFCAGNSPVTGELPSQRPVTRSFWCFLWSAPWINGCVNNREAGDLRRHRPHYDVIVMELKFNLGRFYPYLSVLVHWLWGNKKYTPKLAW